MAKTIFSEISFPLARRPLTKDIYSEKSIYRRRVTTATMFCLIKTTQPHHLQLDR
jgi:hypothetical protein